MIREFEISLYEKMLCAIVSKFKKKNKIPGIIKKRSNGMYGRKDNLTRYYAAKHIGVTIGKYTYGYNNLNLRRVKSIGKYCSIADNINVLSGTHRTDYVTTSPILDTKDFGFTDYLVVDNSVANSRKIEIGNDVYIGADVTIFAGVKVNDGAVIAAGAIVRKDVPPYAVVGGVDRILKYRFSEDVIEKLLKIKWWNWTDEKIRENINLMYDAEQFVNKFYKVDSR